ncbi:MAG TPA: phage tail tube protein [Novosphingobium sp.]|nr:phage tail tube protein [Novosphingobium sp.]
MPKFWRSKTLLAKAEATYGVDPAPTGAANAILAMNVTFTPQEGEVVKRAVERPYFGAQPFVAQSFRASLSFEVDLVGSGAAGTAPAWGPLLRACAVAQTVTAGVKVEYTPITDSQESVAMYFDVDGIKHVMLGAKGNAVIRAGVNGNPVLAFNLMSLFTAPVDAAKPSPDYTAWPDPQAASKANTPTYTIGGAAFVARSYELDLGNQVEPRMLIGYEGILITGREESLKMTVEAVAAATFNPPAVVAAGTKLATSLLHGTVVGRKVQVDTPAAQLLPIGQLAEQQGVVEWTLPFVPLPVTGNDQWKITLT